MAAVLQECTKADHDHEFMIAVVDGMLDKTLASEIRGQSSKPAARPTCELAGEVHARHKASRNPLGTGPSIDDAFYPWWGLDVLSKERRLAGECNYVSGA